MSANPAAVAAEPLDMSMFNPVSLAEVVTEAAQLTRVDRKYLVDRRVARQLLDRLGDTFRVLSIDGRHSTTYRSTYFDTSDLATCRAHLQRRRRRWKARSRLYVEDQLCRIEVKTRDGRGTTLKTVADSHPARYGRLDDLEATFVSGVLSERGIDIDTRTLRPSMEIVYRRTTLADTRHATRMTLDSDVRCTLDGNRVWFDDSCVLIETKGSLRPAAADRLLAALGARQRSFSKYASSASLLRNDLADNDIRDLHGRQLHSARLMDNEDISR